ncbi:Dyp-type peroxidase [Ilumatobacter sp.]|uniref:Dyp-type peroxidase n=1 Tax=Ilumatobacter sp. TaxID=1967498 RepID=UPI003C354E00
MVTHIDLADVQGNLLRGYGSGKRYVRHLIVTVRNAAAARSFIADAADGMPPGPAITTSEEWTVRPLTCLNVGFSATGLAALGLSRQCVDSFPAAFREGAVGRATKVGDVDQSDPSNWRDGMSDPDKVHAMWTIFADTIDARDALSSELEVAWRRSGAFSTTARLDGEGLDDDKVHFGYRDSISQPRFEIDGEVIGREDAQPVAPLGALLLGPYETTFPDVQWTLPEPSELAVNGCFNAFRVLEQDVVGFELFLHESAQRLLAEHPGMVHPEVDPVEFIAAKLMGRWRNGVPLSYAVEHAAMQMRPGGETETDGRFVDGMPVLGDSDDLNDFDYPDERHDFDDFDGTMCPMGAHIRRGNPRGSRIVQRSANHTRPIVRRGVPYGPAYDPSAGDDGVPRGLLGSFLCADLAAQYEALMYDWINLGLQDPRVTGTNDVIIGANRSASSRFEIPFADGSSLTLRHFPRFTHTVGSVYLFCPSMTALRHIAATPSTP